MKTKTIVVALATLLIGSLCFWACQKEDIQQVKPVETENILLKAGHGEPKFVPWRGSGTWQAIDFEFIAEDEIRVTSELRGITSHTGRLRSGEVFIYYKIDPETGAILEYLRHTTTLTAANGDQIFDETEGENGLNFNPEDQTPPWDWHGEEIILVGGTGRFENVEGWYAIWGTGTPEDGYGNWIIEGWISTVGSTK